MKNMKKIPEVLEPLPYGGDRKPGEPTEDEIKAMRATMPGRPVHQSRDPQRRARVQTHGSSYRTHRDG